MTWGTWLQDPSNGLEWLLYEFHNDILFYLILILIVVMYVLLKLLQHYSWIMWQDMVYYSPLKNGPERFRQYFLSVNHAYWLEIIWTLSPFFILLGIIVPSFMVLFYSEYIGMPHVVVKVVGRQWYWEVEVFYLHKWGPKVN